MLITADDIRKHRPIALNLDDEKRLNTYIGEAELLDIIPVIGAKLYKEIKDTPTNFTELLDGGYYDNDTKYFAGLKAALSMLSYARFILNNSVNATPFGVQRKNALDSEPVEDKTLFRHSNEAKNVGLAYLQQCVDYLTYENGRKCGEKTTVKQRKFSIVGD